MRRVVQQHCAVLLQTLIIMIFNNPNLYRQGNAQCSGRYGVHNTGLIASSRQTYRQPLPGNRRNLGVYPGRGEFTTAILVVFSLGGFLFVCGIFMLFGGLGDHSKVLVGLGVASVIGGTFLSVMGWTLCFKLRCKRNQREPRCTTYTTHNVTPQSPLPVTSVGPPPAYSPLPGTPELGAENNSGSASPLVSVQYHRHNSHRPMSSPGVVMEDQVVFNFPPPSYDEALKSQGV